MCGIVGLCLGNQNEQAAFELFEAALLLQHRGQYSCGIATADSSTMFCQKGSALLMEVFGALKSPEQGLIGHIGLAHGTSRITTLQKYYCLIIVVRFSTTRSYEPT